MRVTEEFYENLDRYAKMLENAGYEVEWWNIHYMSYPHLVWVGKAPVPKNIEKIKEEYIEDEDGLYYIEIRKERHFWGTSEEQKCITYSGEVGYVELLVDTEKKTLDWYDDGLH